MITSIRTVALYVSDQQKARDFYVDKLGFEVRVDSDMGPMGRWLEVGPPGSPTGFVLANAEKFEKLGRVGDSADVTLGSPDIGELHKRLVANGVQVTEPVTEDWGTFVQITDLDGQEFVITEQR